MSLVKLYNVIAQKESKLNFQMAGEQRKLAHASKRDSSTMKTISLLGSVFLPGAYLAVSLSAYDRSLLKLTLTVNIFHNVLQLSKYARYSLSRIPEFLALLGGNNSNNSTSCGDLVLLGKEERGAVRQRGRRLRERLRGHGENHHGNDEEKSNV
jgi:hypothetical protein